MTVWTAKDLQSCDHPGVVGVKLGVLNLLHSRSEGLLPAPPVHPACLVCHLLKCPRYRRRPNAEWAGRFRFRYSRRTQPKTESRSLPTNHDYQAFFVRLAGDRRHFLSLLSRHWYSQCASSAGNWVISNTYDDWIYTLYIEKPLRSWEWRHKFPTENFLKFPEKLE